MLVYMVPLHKGKGDKCECSNSRCISLLIVVGKLLGRMLINRVTAKLNVQYERSNVGLCMVNNTWDQVFAISQVCEKYQANRKYVFWALMDLENAPDTIDRYGMWQMLRVYGIGGKL